jgi:Mg-chelatase subunit ChlD
MTKSLRTTDRPTTPSHRADVDAFLAAVKTAPKPGTSGNGRLMFAMDATMSRKGTWDRAISIQGDMFTEAAKSGELLVQLVYFRGFREAKVSKWISDSRVLARLMSTVECRGGNTQIARVIGHAKSETTKQRVNAVVFVGDAMEENPDQLCALAGELGLLGTPMFMFQEGHDRVTEETYKEIARLSGGAYFKLNDQSAAALSEVLRAVAAYAAGGHMALESAAAKSPAVRAIASQMKK